MRLEVLMSVKLLMLVFWVVMLCGLTGRHQHFRKTYCLYLKMVPSMLVSAYNSTWQYNPEGTKKKKKKRAGIGAQSKINAFANVVAAQIVPGLLVLAIAYLGCNITLVLIAWFFAVTLITASYSGAMSNLVDIAPNLEGK
jgi:hypothetical protein